MDTDAASSGTALKAQGSPSLPHSLHPLHVCRVTAQALDGAAEVWEADSVVFGVGIRAMQVRQARYWRVGASGRQLA